MRGIVGPNLKLKVVSSRRKFRLQARHGKLRIFPIGRLSEKNIIFLLRNILSKIVVNIFIFLF